MVPDVAAYPKIPGENGPMVTGVDADGTPLFETTMLTVAVVPGGTRLQGTWALICELVPVPGCS